MDLVLSIILMMGRVLMETFTSPLFILIYLGLFFIVSWQYKRMEKLSETIVGSGKNLYLRSALMSIFLGLLGGLLGSVLLVFVGIELSNIGIVYLWLLAIVLMIIHPRFLCFAYGGGILAIFSLLTGYPEISIPQLMGLIAVLHMIESVLILLEGYFNPVPIYVKKKNGIRGGFNLQKFWPLPLIALLGTAIVDSGAGIAMPDWWPLLKDYSSSVDKNSYCLVPVLAVLGYGEISTTTTPYRRVRQSALRLFLFSLSLLTLSILASRWDELLIIAALFSPLGHELVIWLGIRDESKQQALYIRPARGIMVLDVKPESVAQQAGIKSQDIILSINGEIVNDSYTLKDFLSYSRGRIDLKILRGQEEYMCKLKWFPSHDLGLIFVPENNTRRYLSIEEDSFFDMASRLWRRLR